MVALDTVRWCPGRVASTSRPHCAQEPCPRPFNILGHGWNPSEAHLCAHSHIQTGLWGLHAQTWCQASNVKTPLKYILVLLHGELFVYNFASFEDHILQMPCFSSLLRYTVPRACQGILKTLSFCRLKHWLWLGNELRSKNQKIEFKKFLIYTSVSKLRRTYKVTPHNTL